MPRQSPSRPGLSFPASPGLDRRVTPVLARPRLTSTASPDLGTPVLSTRARPRRPVRSRPRPPRLRSPRPSVPFPRQPRPPRHCLAGLAKQCWPHRAATAPAAKPRLVSPFRLGSCRAVPSSPRQSHPRPPRRFMACPVLPSLASPGPPRRSTPHLSTPIRSAPCMWCPPATASPVHSHPRLAFLAVPFRDRPAAPRLVTTSHSATRRDTSSLSCPRPPRSTSLASPCSPRPFVAVPTIPRPPCHSMSKPTLTPPSLR
jgi:hypothetical protein